MKRALGFLQHQFLPALLAFAAVLLLARTDWFQRLENLSLDWRTRQRARFQAPVDARWRVVGIDDDSLQAYGRWPWARQIHGKNLFLLGKEEPAVVAWDLLFTEPDEAEPFNDQALVAAAKRVPDTAVVFGAVATEADVPDVGTGVTVPFRPEAISGDLGRIPVTTHAAVPIAGLRDSARMAFVDTPPAPDGVRRVVPLLMRYRGGVYPSLSLQTLLAFWHVPVDQVRIRLGDAIAFPTPDGGRRVPIDKAGGFTVNYRCGLADAPVIGYAQLAAVLEAKYVAHVPVRNPPALRGRILLVGQVAAGLTDNGPSPFSAEAPLVLVHGNVIDNILRRDFVRVVPPALVWSVAFLIALTGITGLAEGALWRQIVFTLLVPLATAVAATAAWTAWNLDVEFVGPVAAFGLVQVYALAQRVVREQRAKAEIKGMFSSYLAPALVNRLIEAGEPPQLGGHEAEVTAYFSDIQAFSTFSEVLPPDRLVELMNEYLTACTDILHEEGGTLDKYVGDMVVGIFGAPVPLADHAYRACVVSQRVQARLAELRAEWTQGRRWPAVVTTMRSRIGLNSGRCIVGNMGSRTRFNYTMMGDDVNLASRMESGAKHFGVYSMCTEATKLGCERDGPGRVVFRPLGRVVVKGRAHAVPIFEIAGLTEEVTTAMQDCLAEFGAGMARYDVRDWAGAAERFRRSATLEWHQPGRTPGVTTTPSHFFLELALRHAAQPPAGDGPPVLTLSEK